MGKIRVAIIYGGVSGEHSVSCLTAASVMRAIDREKYEVVPVAIAKDGTWVPGVDNPDLLEAGGPHGEVTVGSERVLTVYGPGRDLLVADDAAGKLRSLGPIDIAFPLLHGPCGEDGTIQGLFELMGLPYVGCGVFASAAGMDKHYTKMLLQEHGIPCTPHVLADPARWENEREKVREEAAQLGFPLYVKPARAGSSLGITRVAELSELDAAVEAARQVDGKVLIEQGIPGREIECAVLGGHGTQPPRATVLGEIVLTSQWYDFETKYEDNGGFSMQIPAHIPPQTATEMRECAVKVFTALGCEGLARVDFFLTEDPARPFVVNEINTMPGFTNVSMYPALWEASGLPYSALIDELITLGLERPLACQAY